MAGVINVCAALALELAVGAAAATGATSITASIVVASAVVAVGGKLAVSAKATDGVLLVKLGVVAVDVTAATAPVAAIAELDEATIAWDSAAASDAPVDE